MKSNGSVYVALVFAARFNPARAAKQRLGEVAFALSVPEHESDVARIGRLAQLRKYLDDDLRLKIGAEDIRSRDAALGIAAGWQPPAGSGDVHFADVQLFIESDTAAHAYLAVELASLDKASGHSTVDSRDASVSMARKNGEWVITAAESKEMPRVR